MSADAQNASTNPQDCDYQAPTMTDQASIQTVAREGDEHLTTNQACLPTQYVAAMSLNASCGIVDSNQGPTTMIMRTLQGGYSQSDHRSSAEAIPVCLDWDLLGADMPTPVASPSALGPESYATDGKYLGRQF